MEEANFIIKKEVFMMGSGRITICTDSGNYTTLMGQWLTKVNGLSINSMEKGKFITMFQLRSMVCSILKTSMIWRRNGNIIKELWCQILKKDKGNWCFQMDNFTKDSLRMTR